MKHHTPSISVSAADLRKALSFAAATVERRNTIPILGAVRFDAAEGKITVTGTDLDNEAVSWCEAEIDAPPMSFCLGPRMLDHLLRYAAGTVQFTRTEEVLTVRVDDMTASFRELFPKEDFPFLMWSDAATDCGTIAECKLRDAFVTVAVSISKEPTRYYLNGVFLQTHEDQLRMVTTDGHRMSVLDTKETWVGSNAILPTKAVDLLRRAMVPNGNRAVAVRQSGELKLEFSTEDWRLRSKLIDGIFPDYTRVIPPTSDVIEVSLTAAALNRFPVDPWHGRAIKIAPSEGYMSFRDASQNEFQLPVRGHGPEFGMNIVLLKAFARQSGTIHLNGSGKDSPFRLTTENPNLLQVVMPMRV